MTYRELRQIARLKRYYEIRGDGVARLNLIAACKSPRFQNQIRKLYKVKV